ncbi:MAG: COX15/CtaA family protein [Chitinophagaceae bacterium]|nr:COX15/CtaA family protein [Chitinophagaceae bacterium]MBL0336551.1 COX15/CtaA family protein [Chitinophagaceae bacterium]
MQSHLLTRSSRPVAIWILIGIFMLVVQVLLGGVTRLTGSGLSITEWKPIMGALPPMNEHDWNLAFEKYKQIAQYKFVNAYFTLSDFKSIFFWEWFHRLWARLIGVVFLIPFITFIIQRRIRKEMIRPLIVLFLLGGLQGLVGWIMVMSGLEDSELLYVSHYKLAIHFILAMGLVCYAFWFALEMLVPREQITRHTGLRKFATWIMVLLVIQLVYGAFMAGLKIANAAPTWPDINGRWLPTDIHQWGSREMKGLSFLTDHPLVIHFIHRGLAYIIAVLIFIWWWKARKVEGTAFFRNTRYQPLLLVLLQVLLGILTVLNANTHERLLYMGVSHQFTAMMLLLGMFWVMYIVRKERAI